jgi:hypothetical protein
MTVKNGDGVPKQWRSGSQKRQRQSQVKVGLLTEERAVLKEKATAAGVSLASFMRVCALNESGPRARRAPTIEIAAMRDCTAALQAVARPLERVAHAENALHREEAQRLFASVGDLLAELNKLVGRES